MYILYLFSLCTFCLFKNTLCNLSLKSMFVCFLPVSKSKRL
ncbi:hypothetical protein HMPREF0973_00176 [Prevotella veroralis F0319]|uniref:Uncharacterized protein n=1 Tax=Prevotella veroralis F0319 TaxID=649761 RepID=C9MKQ2_9BACT|nr:hypothetical protein HMPREF0973_00176 [Prevotella veroralis F0319]